MAIGFSTVFVARQGLTRWWVIPIFFLPFVVLAVMTVVVLRLQRSGLRWFPQPVRLVGPDRATRPRVRGIVRKGQLPTEEPDRALAVEMVQATERVRWARWSMLVTAVLFGIEAITTDSRWLRIVLIAYLVFARPIPLTFGSFDVIGP